MKWNGIELVEITEPEAYKKPREMLVWGTNDAFAHKERISAVTLQNTGVYAVSWHGNLFPHCAKIPEKPKPRRATWKELAYWLMDGKGLVVDENTSRVDTGVFFNRVDLDAEVSDNLKVMRRDDADWHKPTVDYLGLEV